MVALETPICDFGWNAPDFDLPAQMVKVTNLKMLKVAMAPWLCSFVIIVLTSSQ